MRHYTPEQVINFLKEHDKYYDISREKVCKKIHSEGEFLLRPSSITVPHFEMFALSYVKNNKYEHDLYGISEISGLCFHFRGGKKQVTQLVSRFEHFDPENISECFKNEIVYSSNDKHSSLILSTQSLNTHDKHFPREGGTAIALQHFTGLPIVKMHRNGQATEDEKGIYERIANGSTVFITGHAKTGANVLSGIYIDPNEGRIDYSHPLEHYRNVLIENSQLKAGDTLNIVLWCCKGAAGTGTKPFNSTAAKLAKSFWEKGFGTRILASTENIKRFNGSVSDEEINQEGLQFRVYGPQNQHMFECMDGRIRFYSVIDPVYFGSTLPNLADLLVIKREEESLESDSSDMSLSDHSHDSDDFDDFELSSSSLSE